MKITYTLDFDDPKADIENLSHDRFCINNAHHFADVIKNYDIYLRNLLKYNSEKYTPSEIELIEELREFFNDLIKDSYDSIYNFI
jgi:hypothetical protein